MVHSVRPFDNIHFCLIWNFTADLQHIPANKIIALIFVEFIELVDRNIYCFHFHRHWVFLDISEIRTHEQTIPIAWALI